LANNQLTGYTYDAAGNMTSDPTDSVISTYDPENRIATATKSGVTTAYTYDDDGNRVEKSSGGGGALYWSPGERVDHPSVHDWQLYSLEFVEQYC
jgi:YD repeat-containing protein